MQRSSIFLLLALCVNCNSQPVLATSVIDERDVKYITGISNRIAERVNLRDTKLSDAGQFSVNYDSDTGLVKKIVLKHHGKSLQAETNLIDAIVTDTPLESSASFEKWALDKEMTFGVIKDPHYRANKEPIKNVFLHKIPLSVFERYPGSFTWQELTSTNNLQKVNSELVDTTFIQKVREPWIEFFKKNKTASRTQIESLANEIKLSE
jgi:hypothetical protein